MDELEYTVLKDGRHGATLPPELYWRLLDPGPVCLLTTPNGAPGQVSLGSEPWRMMSSIWTRGVSFKPPIMEVAVGVGKKFGMMLKATNKICVNVPGGNLVDWVKICGGKVPAVLSEDRMKATRATIDETGRIMECAGWIWGKVTRVDTVGDHDLFFSTVERVEVAREFFDCKFKVWNGHVGLIRNYGGGVLKVGP